MTDVVLLVSASPAVFCSAIVLSMSVVTETDSVPAPRGPSGSVTSSDRLRDPPGVTTPLPGASTL